MNRALVAILALALIAAFVAVMLLLRGGAETALGPRSGELDRSGDAVPPAARRDTAAADPQLEVAHDAVPGGRCRVTGRVVDRESGRPLAGASLSVRLVAGEAPFTAAVASTRHGRFVLDGLPPTREGWLVASAVDRGTRVVGPFDLEAGDALDVGDVTLGPGGRVWGRVTGPDGGGVAGAEVALREVEPPLLAELLTGLERMFERRPPAARAVTDAGGRYEIPGVPRGIWHAAVTAAGRATLHRTDVWINGRGLPTRLDFRMVRGERLRGRVVDGEDRPVPGARVCVVPALNGRDLSIIVRRHHTVTDGAGRFEIDSLEAGDVEVLVSTARGHVARHRRVDVPADDVVVRVGGTRTLEGRVTVAGTGAPLAGVEVHVSDPTMMAHVRTDAEGAYRVAGLGGKGWRLHVDHPDYVVTEATRLAAATGDVVHHDIEVERGFTVRGRVVDATTSRPVRGAVVSAERDEMAGMARARTDADGRYVLEGVLPGKRRLLARARGYGFNPEDQRRRHPEVEGASGDVVECDDILLARTVRVRGRVTTRVSDRESPVVGARVTTSPYGELQARMLGTRSENTVSDRDGRFELDSSWTTNGFIHVRASHPDLAARVVVVEGAKPGGVVDVEVEMDRGVVVDGLVRDPERRPLEGVRVIARFNADHVDVHHEQLRERFGYLARTDSAGRYTLRLPRSPGYLQFERVAWVQLTPGPLPYEPDGQTGAITAPDVVFAPWQRVRGAVRTASGAPYDAPVIIEIVRNTPDGLPWSVTRRFESGASFDFSGVPRGLYDVTVRDAARKDLVEVTGVRSGVATEIRLP